MDLSDYVGLPFVETGRDRSGIDCWGLCVLVYGERFGLVLPSYNKRYSTIADREHIASIIAGELGRWREIPATAERAGDALMMSLGGVPMHIGIVTGRGLVLHTERGAGSVIQSYRSPRLARRVLGFFRHESLA